VNLESTWGSGPGTWRATGPPLSPLPTRECDARADPDHAASFRLAPMCTHHDRSGQGAPDADDGVNSSRLHLHHLYNAAADPSGVASRFLLMAMSQWRSLVTNRGFADANSPNKRRGRVAGISLAKRQTARWVLSARRFADTNPKCADGDPDWQRAMTPWQRDERSIGFESLGSQSVTSRREGPPDSRSRPTSTRPLIDGGLFTDICGVAWVPIVQRRPGLWGYPLLEKRGEESHFVTSQGGDTRRGGRAWG
jgi:hypothetical protein